MHKQLDIVSHSAEQTRDLAETLAPHFREPNVVVLTGPLGAGKTVFVKGLARALQISEERVSSPSYTMVNEYDGQSALYHFDLYRMEHESELKELGWDDYLQRDGLVVIEWGEKVPNALLVRYYAVRIEILNDQDRHITVNLKSS